MSRVLPLSRLLFVPYCTERKHRCSANQHALPDIHVLSHPATIICILKQPTLQCFPYSWSFHQPTGRPIVSSAARATYRSVVGAEDRVVRERRHARPYCLFVVIVWHVVHNLAKQEKIRKRVKSSVRGHDVTLISRCGTRGIKPMSAVPQHTTVPCDYGWVGVASPTFETMNSFRFS